MSTMAAAAPYLQYAGTAASAYGAYANSQGTKDAYGMQGQIAANNAQIAGWQAEDALARGDREASNVRMRANQVKGSQRARMAANGVDLGVGSALQVLTDTDYFADVDAGTIKDNAAKEAWAIRNQANNFSAESDLLKYRSDRESPWMAAGTSGLTSAGRVSSGWYGSGTGGGKTVPIYPGAEY
jgi:hypothetical protein